MFKYVKNAYNEISRIFYEPVYQNGGEKLSSVKLLVRPFNAWSAAFPSLLQNQAEVFKGAYDEKTDFLINF